MTTNSTDPTLKAVAKLLETMQTLRSPDGCEWDRKQTPESLKKYILEETYEVLEAIDSGNPARICDELGDLLLQVVFQAQISEEQGDFGIMEVANTITAKLLRRHPHIFSSASPDNRDSDWERIKREELTEKGESLLLKNRIPQALPALKRAEKIVSALARDARLPSSEGQNSLSVLKMLCDTIETQSSHQLTEQQFGDILYELAALASRQGIDAEDSLRQSVDRRINKYDQELSKLP